MLRLKYGVLCGYFIDEHLFTKVMLKTEVFPLLCVYILKINENS